MEGDRQRHGCVTAWLALTLLSNAVLSVSYLVFTDSVVQRLPHASFAAIAALGAIGVLNVVFAVALMRWKKWGFFGFAAASVATFAINLSIGLSPLSAMFGFAGVAILYGVLHIGETRAAWPQLD